MTLLVLLGDACLETVYTSAGPPVGTRHLITALRWLEKMQ